MNINSNDGLDANQNNKPIVETDVNLNEDIITNNNTNEYIDKITLELLLNKNHYNNYLSKTNPKKFEEFKDYKQKLKNYSVDIIDITSQLIENPKTQFSNEIEETFQIYVKSIFKYIELNEVKKANKYYDNQDDDEDTMFLNIDNNDNGNKNYEKKDEYNTISHSFWGKEKVIKKQSSILDNDLNMMKFYKSKKYN